MRNIIHIILLTSLMWPCSIWAGEIPIGAFSGGETVIDFEVVPVTPPPIGPFSIGQVTFSESSTGTGGSGWRLLNLLNPPSRILTDNAGISNILLDFATPFQRVGLDVGIGPATYQIDFFGLGLSLLGTITGSVTSTAGAGSEFFAGWQDAAGILRIQITETSGENELVGGLDNVRFELAAQVPTPTTLVLFGLGLAGLGFARRKKA